MASNDFFITDLDNDLLPDNIRLDYLIGSTKGSQAMFNDQYSKQYIYTHANTSPVKEQMKLKDKDLINNHKKN